jgi:hypothetical protein
MLKDVKWDVQVRLEAIRHHLPAPPGRDAPASVYRNCDTPRTLGIGYAQRKWRQKESLREMRREEGERGEGRREE